MYGDRTELLGGRGRGHQKCDCCHLFHRRRSCRTTEEERALAKGILRLGKWQESLDGARRAAAAYALATLYDGDTGRLLSWPEDVEAVSADQVEAVAKKISTRGPWTLSSSAPSSGSARHGIRAGRRIWMRCRPPEMITHWSSARWPVLFAVATLGVTSLSGSGGTCEYS